MQLLNITEKYLNWRKGRDSQKDSTRSGDGFSDQYAPPQSSDIKIAQSAVAAFFLACMLQVLAG
jgi:hypothetical protein